MWADIVVDMMKRKGAQCAQTNVCLPVPPSVAATEVGQQLDVYYKFVFEGSDDVVGDKVSCQSVADDWKVQDLR